jgi:prepilin signal peptidase PulO-like enzyme (type II secretory pathway)
MVTFVTPIVVALIFAGASFLGLELSSVLGARFLRERTRTEMPRGVTLGLVAGGAIFGAVAAAGGSNWQALAMAAVVCVSLVGCWHSAVVFGRIPDYFTLVPLGAVLLAAVVQGEWFLVLGSAAPFVPFAAMAYFWKGRGFDWDDAKLAALGGAILGLQASILALAAACMVAVVVALARQRKTEPIVFAPYMVGAIGIALAWRLMP